MPNSVSVMKLPSSYENYYQLFRAGLYLPGFRALGLRLDTMKSIKSLYQSVQVDFSAKVRWRMIYDKNPLFITVQDKYEVREYATARGVKTANLLYVTDKPESIPFAELPQKYLIKASHGCGWNILGFNSKLYLYGNGKNLINPDGSLLNMDSAPEYELSQDKAIQLCKEWMGRRYREREWAYRHLTPRIVVEELLETKDNKALVDYKMYTFHGVVKAISVRSAVYRRNSEIVIFDPDWNEIELTAYKTKRPDTIPERPARLAEMIDIAQKLGEELDFARIDLYDTTQGIILGEVTIYPDGGLRDKPTSDPVFNKWLGDQWKLKRIAVINAFCRNVASNIRASGFRLIHKYQN